MPRISISSKYSRPDRPCATMQGRFAKPVFPGETLKTEMWVTSPTTVVFQTQVVERDALAITNAAVEFVQPVSKL